METICEEKKDAELEKICADLSQRAKANDNKLSYEIIDSVIGNRELDDAAIDKLFDFLVEQNIAIDDVEIADPAPKYKDECSAAVVIEEMERWATKKLAESWDNPGLIVGSGARHVKNILTCLDVTEEIADEAIKRDCQMIIAHHPLLFKPLKNLCTDQPLGKLLQKLLAADIVVYAAHTNLDIAAGGVNDILAEKIGLTDLEPFSITQEEPLEKLVVFVPDDYAEKMRDALAKAGAGAIGHYSACSYTMAGTGRFLPDDAAHPFNGKMGELAAVAEQRIEVIFPAPLEKRIVRAMLAVHPYEEPAYDLIPLKNHGRVDSLGRIGHLAEPLTLDEFAARVKQNLNAAFVRIVRPPNTVKPIKKVALCSGAGAEFIDKASFKGADVYVTGDVRYHDARRAQELGLAVIDAGHFPTENPIAETIAARLADALQQRGIKLNFHVDRLTKDAFEII